MKTIAFKFKTDNVELQKAIAEDSRVCSSMRRFAFNRFPLIPQNAVFSRNHLKVHTILYGFD